MLRFICKTSHRVMYAVNASRTHFSYFQRSHPFSTSLKSIEKSSNKHLFALSYLVNSCGLSPEKALSASRRVKFETRDKPDSVMAFFKTHGFTQTQISTMVRSYPSVILCDTQKTLLPKLEFLYSKGLSSTDVARIISKFPYIMQRSLPNSIIPSFNFFNNLLQSEQKTLAFTKHYAGFLLFDHQSQVRTNIEILRKAGVPNANIVYLLKNQPRAFATSGNKFRESVDEVKNMGFNPLKVNFMLAVQALRGMSKSTWQKKVEVYKKWGWTQDGIMVAFGKNPWCMIASEDKINRVMDFLVNKMGSESSFAVRWPVIISMSLEKRIIPRYEVYQALLSKGLVKSNGISLVTLLGSSEKLFRDKFVNKNKEEAPELLKLYKGKLDLQK